MGAQTTQWIWQRGGESYADFWWAWAASCFALFCSCLSTFPYFDFSPMQLMFSSVQYSLVGWKNQLILRRWRSENKCTRAETGKETFKVTNEQNERNDNDNVAQLLVASWTNNSIQLKSKYFVGRQRKESSVKHISSVCCSCFVHKVVCLFEIAATLNPLQ